MDHNDFIYCSGALIKEEWVITSASCYGIGVKIQLGGNQNATKHGFLIKTG